MCCWQAIDAVKYLQAELDSERQKMNSLIVDKSKLTDLLYITSTKLKDTECQLERRTVKVTKDHDITVEGRVAAL